MEEHVLNKNMRSFLKFFSFYDWMLRPQIKMTGGAIHFSTCVFKFAAFVMARATFLHFFGNRKDGFEGAIGLGIEQFDGFLGA